ncbi:hypothetical protein AB0H37_23965 [Actinomadura sp. NPDC023710]|uniref:hypothetical protein n=1 Tax=Actinomadura sp. NPDC023710 TaxID=3158219 RepID=UPI0033E96B3D
MTEPRGLAGGVEVMRNALKKEGNDRMLDVVDGFGQRDVSEIDVGFALLVPFKMRADGRIIPLRESRHRTLLPVILPHTRWSPPLGEWAEVTWSDERPAHPRLAAKLNVTLLCKMLGSVLSPDAVATSVHDHRLNVEPEPTDLVRFRARLSVAAATAGRTHGLSRTGRTGGAGVMLTHANLRTGDETASGADRWPRCAP